MVGTIFCLADRPPRSCATMQVKFHIYLCEFWHLMTTTTSTTINGFFYFIFFVMFCHFLAGTRRTGRDILKRMGLPSRRAVPFSKVCGLVFSSSSRLEHERKHRTSQREDEKLIYRRRSLSRPFSYVGNTHTHTHTQGRTKAMSECLVAACVCLNFLFFFCSVSKWMRCIV